MSKPIKKSISCSKNILWSCFVVFISCIRVFIIKLFGSSETNNHNSKRITITKSHRYMTNKPIYVPYTDSSIYVSLFQYVSTLSTNFELWQNAAKGFFCQTMLIRNEIKWFLISTGAMQLRNYTGNEIGSFGFYSCHDKWQRFEILSEESFIFVRSRLSVVCHWRRKMVYMNDNNLSHQEIRFFVNGSKLYCLIFVTIRFDMGVRTYKGIVTSI